MQIRLRRGNCVLILGMLFVFSCGGPKKAMRKYIGTWDVISAYGKTYAEAKATLEFRGETNVMGYSGCNNYAGTYSLNEGELTLSFGPLMATKKMCPGIQSECERQLFRALNNTSHYLPKPEGIYLQNSQKETLAFIKKK